MKKKVKLLVTFSTLTVAIVTMSAIGGQSLGNAVFKADATAKTLVLDNSNSPTLVEGEGVAEIEYATFTYSGASDSASGHVALANSGTISKDEAKGLESVNAVFEGEITLYSGFTANDLCFVYDLTSGVSQEITGNYLQFLAKAASDIESITLTYSCDVESPESYQYEEGYTSDIENHWHACSDPHCTKIDGLEAHTYAQTTELNTDLATETDEVTFTCSVCGHEVTETYSRAADGKVPLGSPRGATTFGTKLGSSIQSYAVAAWRTGFTVIDDEIAIIFNMRTAASGDPDGTNTGAGFRIMSGFTQTDANKYHKYAYKFKNMGSSVLNFEVYGRTSGTDTSAVDAYSVSLQPGEEKNVSVNFATQNNNLLSYFRFNDSTFENARLAVALHYYDSTTANVTLTNAEFSDGSTTKEFECGSLLSDVEFDGEILGYSDNLGNINDVARFKVHRDVDVTVVSDDVVYSGSGKLNLYDSSKMYLDNYSVNSGRNNPTFTYIGDELAEVIAFPGSAGGTDNTGTNASFRFRTTYSSGSGYKSNFIYTFKNLGDQTLTFDVYQRSSGSDTSTPTYYNVVLDPDEVETVYLAYETNVSSNELTYVRFSDSNWQGQKMAVYAYAYAYPSSYVKVGLAGGPTFTDGSTSGYFASGSSLSVINIPEAHNTDLVHSGWYLYESGVVQDNVVPVTPGVSRTLYPMYDVESYYVPRSTSTTPSDLPDLTTEYQKIHLEQGYKLHPSNGYGETFSSSNRPNISSSGLINLEGDYERATRYTYDGTVTAGSHYLIMNSVKNTASKLVDSRMLVQNNGSEDMTINIYACASSSNPKDLLIAANKTIPAGEVLEIEALSHTKAANGNSVYCIEFVNELSSLDYCMVKYMRYSS